MLRRQAIFASLFPHLQQDAPPVNTPDLDPDRWVAQGGNTAALTGSGREQFFPVDEAPEQPQWQDVSVGEETPTPAPITTFDDFSQGLNNSRPKPRQQTWEESHPEFQYPHVLTEGQSLTGQQQAENALARSRYQREHPENLDRGVKGVLKEILGNFFEGLKYAKPGMGLKESLLMGGVGAGLGGVNRTWNESRQLDKLIPELEKDVEQETQTALKKAQTVDTLAKPADRYQEFQRKVTKDAVEAEYKDNLVALGKQKADDVKTYREAIIDLRRSGVAQNDRRITILEDRIKEAVRHNKQTEKQQATNETGRNTRTDKIIGGQNTRNRENNDVRLRLQKDAQQYGREQAITNAATGFKEAFFKAKGKNPTQAEIDAFINSAVIPEIDAEADFIPNQ